MSGSQITPSVFTDFGNLMKSCIDLEGYGTSRAGTIQLSSDTIRIAIHAMQYDAYHDISTPTQLHLEVLFLQYIDKKMHFFSIPFANHSIRQIFLLLFLEN